MSVLCPKVAKDCVIFILKLTVCQNSHICYLQLIDRYRTFFIQQTLDCMATLWNCNQNKRNVHLSAYHFLALSRTQCDNYFSEYLPSTNEKLCSISENKISKIYYKEQLFLCIPNSIIFLSIKTQMFSFPLFSELKQNKTRIYHITDAQSFT